MNQPVLRQTTSFLKLLIGKKYLFTLFSSLFIAAFFFNQHLHLNSDSSSLLQATRVLLAGGNYIGEIFTPNPPLILYLYTLPVILSQWLNLNIVTLFPIYIFTLVAISLSVCHSMTRKIQAKEALFPTTTFVIVLAIILLFLPFDDIGQRDHLLVVFTLPYLLTVIYRLLGGSVPVFIAAGIGFFASFGFLLKPYFLMIFMAVEIYYAISQKKMFAWLRPEPIVILLSGISYILIVNLFHPEYIRIILPYLLHHYLYATSSDWKVVYFNTCLPAYLLLVGIYLVERKYAMMKIAKTIFLIALICSILTFFIQHTFYYYHMIPALSFFLISFYFQIYCFYYQTQKERLSFRIIFFSALLLFLICPAKYLYSTYLSRVNYRLLYLDKFAAFVSSAQAKSAYVLSVNPFLFPLVDYTTLKSAQRFDCIWMADSIKKQIIDARGNDQAVIQHFQNNDYLFLRLIVEDFINNKPDIVMVEIPNPNVKPIAINYLYYFLFNPDFRHEWQHYRYLTTIPISDITPVIEIYRREETENSQQVGNNI